MLYFSAHGTRSGMLCYIISVCGTRSGNILLCFLCVERALALLCYIFCMWNKFWCYCVIFFCVWNMLWQYCVIFFACGTRSGVPCAEQALAIFCYILRVWNALWRYCVIFSVHGMRSGVIVLYCPRTEGALAILCYIFCAWNAFWYFVLNSIRVLIYLSFDLPLFI